MAFSLPETNSSNQDAKPPTSKSKQPKKPEISAPISEQAFVELKRANPSATKYEIAKKAQAYGLTKNHRYVYNRFKISDYMRREFAEIERQHTEKLAREIYPLAEKRMIKALKNKELSDKEVFPYVKLAADKVHGEKHVSVGQGKVNIGSVDKLQVMIQNSVQPDGK